MTRVSNLESMLSQLDGDQSVKDGIRSLLKFGLVFEDSQPEVLRLYSGRVTSGCRVDNRSPDIDRFGTVERSPRGVTLDAGVRPVRWDDEPDTIDYVAETSLVPIAKPGESVYPGLDVIDTVERGGGKPHHVVIEGENLHALQALRYTHAGKVDCIYIDPPYNTGGDLIYNDKYLAKEDAFRHSKWLSFMDRRLRIARELLSDTGVIIVAIDDNEQAHLRLLMDEVFGASNFLANVVWEGSGKNHARYTSGGLDYMLVYGRDRTALDAADTRWVETKQGYEKCVTEAARIWAGANGDVDAATAAYRRWLRGQDGIETSLRTHYTEIDEEGRVYQRDNLAQPSPNRPNLRYDVLHPTTGLPVKRHPNGWRHDPARMARNIAEGRVLFGPDHTTTPRYKRVLTDQEAQAIRPNFEQSRMPSSVRLNSLLGEQRFDYPKDEVVLAKWIRAVTGRKVNATVLDFFGGSGSTMHAVMEMNAADGGSRHCILVTNNEVEERQRARLVAAGHFPGDPEFDKHGIFQHVTHPRIKTVATGIREDGSVYSEGVAENVTFARMTYTSRQSVKIGRDFNTIAPLLWLKAGGHGGVLRVDGTNLPQFLVGGHYGVLFESGAGAVSAFAIGIEDAGLEDGADVFVITDDDTRYAHACQRLTNYTVHRLYEDYLSNFEVRA
ncbi:site-specific DNA-methyltransferase [Demequina lutea]|uniref:Adenine-specific DNA-methyltransferase n=1 Tax=Demequina lutea TaxID=431489 RepID=A0A7Z0CKZ3_9MICO|nr:site-specific DNA-methyltransferase [Demequina lutea]NYI42403.1 adenine-specific DNA-methyltransferase [Demequina lutea]